MKLKIVKKIKKWWKGTFIPRLFGTYYNVLALVDKKGSGLSLLHLLSKPRAGKILSYQQKFLNSSTKHLLHTDSGINVQTYHWEGSGTKILLCHGWESNSWRWRKLINHLKSKNFYFIAMDGPAHGASGSDEANGIIYADMIDKVVSTYNPTVLIGHSFGGFGALYYLGHYPTSSIENLIVLASPDRWLDISDQFYKVLGVTKRVKAGVDQAFNRKYDNPQSYYGGANFAKGVKVPGLLIHDVGDVTNKIEEGRRIAENWQQCKMIETSGLGHSLQSPVVYDAIGDYVSALK